MVPAPTTSRAHSSMPANVSVAAAIISAHVCSNPAEVNRNMTDSTAVSAWERFPDIPSGEEILANDSSDSLPWFPLNHKWKTKVEYLEALYKILRFEGIEGLRHAVRIVRDSPSMCENDYTCIYTNVSLPFLNLGTPLRCPASLLSPFLIVVAFYCI